MDKLKEITGIINQEAHTIEDIRKLTQLRFALACEFKNKITGWAAKEWSYNSIRSSVTATNLETMAISKAELLGKAEAEKEHGTYRELKAEAEGIKDIEKAIEWFIIGWSIENKALQETKF